MGSKWPLVTIEDIQAAHKGAIAIGPFGSRMKSDCYVESGIPVIRGTNITGGSDLDGEFVFISEEMANSLGACNVYQNDLVFPHRGSIGEVGIITDNRRYVISSSLMKLTCDETKAYPKFIYYFFKSPIGKYELLKNSSQVGTPGIGQPLSSLKSITLRLPPLEIQDRIIQLLSGLDNKILINRQINQTLEQMVQTLFKSWFVDFDTVIDNALDAGNEIPEPLQARAELRQKVRASKDFQPMPADVLALFPAEFEESELGWVPKGWQVKAADDVSTISIGKTPPRVQTQWFSESNVGNVTWISIKDMGSCGVFTKKSSEYLVPEGVNKFNIRVVPKDSVILSFKLTLGRVSITSSDLTTNEAIAHFVSPKMGLTKEFIYCYLSLFNYESLGSTSSIATAVNSKIIKQMPFLVPTPNISSLFKSKVISLFDKIKFLSEESESLSHIRDILLPELVSEESNLLNRIVRL